MNRSLPGVQQSFFQLILDRELGNDKDGNPYRLHPETRVFAAVNHGAEYDVNDMDPALLRRFWTVDLEPTVDNWLEWARDEESGSSAGGLCPPTSVPPPCRSDQGGTRYCMS